MAPDGTLKTKTGFIWLADKVELSLEQGKDSWERSSRPADLFCLVSKNRGNLGKNAVRCTL